MNRTDRIQKYLDGEMSYEELIKFREDLKTDPELAQEYQLFVSLNETIKLKDEERFRKKLNEAYKIYRVNTPVNESSNFLTKKSGSRTFALVSFSVFIVLGFIVYFQWFHKETNEAIFNRYFVAYSKELNTRELSREKNMPDLLDEGVELYLNSNYEEASQKFNKYLIIKPENVDAHFYNGLCFIYLNEPENAIKSFNYVISRDFNYYQEYAGWYLMLCYIKTGKTYLARELLNEIVAHKGFFSVKAKKVLRKLN